MRASKLDLRLHGAVVVGLDLDAVRDANEFIGKISFAAQREAA